MTDPAQIDQILGQLASGRIDRTEAARLIAALNETSETQPGGADDLVAEATSITEPVSEQQTVDEPVWVEEAVLSGEQPDGSPATDQTDIGAFGASEAAETGDWPGGQSVSAAESQGSAGGSASVDEAVDPGSPAGAEAEEPEQDASGSTAGELANTAEGFVRDASDLARYAFTRLGRFTASTVSKVADVAAETTKASSGPMVRSNADGVQVIHLRSVGRRVRIVGDERVAGYQITGPHTLTRRGEVLEIATEGEFAFNFSPVNLLRPRGGEATKPLSFGPELVITINPRIVVNAEVTGGKLTTVEVPHLGNIRVSVGAGSFSGVQQAEQMLIQACGAALTGPINKGRSNVKVESGTLSLHLTSGADAAIRAAKQLGKVIWPGGMDGDVDEYIVKDGIARITLGVVMGRAVVRIDE